MKTLKRIVLCIVLAMVTVILFRGWLYRNFVSYDSVTERRTYVANSELASILRDESSNLKTADAKMIIERSLKITSTQLKFTSSRNENDPNRLIHTHTAHCVGYAAFFSTTCNYLLAQQGLDERWVATPQVGQLHFLGINIHPYFDSPFFIDHDFVVVRNKITGETISVDPTVADYLFIDYVTLR